MIFHQNTTTLRKLAENIYFAKNPEEREEFLESFKQLGFDDSITVAKQIGEIAFYNWFLYSNSEFYNSFKDLLLHISLLDLSFVPSARAEQQVFGIFWQYINGDKVLDHPEFQALENRKYFLLYRLKMELPIIYDNLDEVFRFNEKNQNWKIAQNQYEKYLVAKEFAD